MEAYVRRVLNIQDVQPNYSNLSVVHIKNISEFLEKQENAHKVTPHLYYKLVDKIVSDVKVAGKEQKVSSSKSLERNRIESIVNKILDKIPRENALITEPFVDAMTFCASNLPEVPNYFLRTVKIAIGNITPKTNAEGVVETESNKLDLHQLLLALSAHRSFIGSIQNNQAVKIS